MDTTQGDQKPERRASQDRTFVLIPGAGGTAWYWYRVAELLANAGHEAIPVDLPGDDPAAGLDQYAKLVTDAIGSRTSVVLVAQSLGGFTAPLVASRVPVHSLIFVNAMIPRPGETPGAWWGNIAVVGEQYQRPEADMVFESMRDFTAWPSVPIRAVAGADDRFFPVAWQQTLARDRLGVEADVLPGGHLIALAQPAELTTYMLAEGGQ